jgi:hypothetical protein
MFEDAAELLFYLLGKSRFSIAIKASQSSQRNFPNTSKLRQAKTQQSCFSGLLTD